MSELVWNSIFVTLFCWLRRIYQVKFHLRKFIWNIYFKDFCFPPQNHCFKVSRFSKSFLAQFVDLGQYKDSQEELWLKLPRTAEKCVCFHNWKAWTHLQLNQNLPSKMPRNLSFQPMYWNREFRQFKCEFCLRRINLINLLFKKNPVECLKDFAKFAIMIILNSLAVSCE